MTDVPRPIADAEHLPPEALRAAQQERFARQIAYVSASSEFYQTLWGPQTPRGAKTPPIRLEALVELPLTDKEALRADQAAHPPFGSYLAAAPDQVSRVHRTGGTSGHGMNLALSATDAATTATIGARAQAASGLGPGHRVIHCLSYQLWMGGYTDHATLEATGATVIPYGVGDTERLVETIRELRVTAISCTPSYPAVIEQVLAESFPALRPRDLGLRLGLFGGEAGLDNPAFRERLENTWGFKARNANYGVTDAFCNFAGQTEVDTDLHYFAADVMYPEIVTPDDGEPVAWTEGATGELVLTHLVRECQPLVRFRTGDIVTITGTGMAPCGRTTPRFRVIGRVDDMVVIRGLNVFPTAIAGIVNRVSDLSGEYRIVLRGPAPYDRLPLEVELAPGTTAGDDIAETLARTIKRELGVTAHVQTLPARTLPRTAHKTQRVFREDQRAFPIEEPSP